MIEKKGTKKTMEMLTLVLAVTELVAKEIKGNGLQWTDAVKILTSTDFQGKLATAISGFADIPGEIDDLSGIEAIDLAEFTLKATRTLLINLGGAA